MEQVVTEEATITINEDGNTQKIEVDGATIKWEEK